MAWTRNETKQLWYREQKIDDLRNEEEEHRLAEMSNDANNGKGHTSKVAQRITNKDLCWTPRQQGTWQWTHDYTDRRDEQTSSV
jgi:hypothetical protein